MASLRDLWALGEDSFRVLLEPRLKRRQAASRPAGGSAAGPEALLPTAADGAERVCREAAHAPPEAVWSALTRLMRGSGIHGLAALEAPNCRSWGDPDLAAPEPRLGDRVGDVLELVDLEAGQALVWRSLGTLELLGHRLEALWLVYRISAPRPDWTCLVARARVEAAISTSAVREHLLDAIELALLVPQLESLRALAEGRQRAEPCTCPSHQAAPFRPATAWPLG